MLSHEGQLKSNEYGNQSNGKANRRNNTKTQKDNESNLKDNLQSPLQRHGKSNKCLECDYKCKTKGHLRSHMLTHNKDPSEVELLKSHDSDQFQRKGNHRKLMHVQKETFKCSECSYECKFRSVLKKHMVKHKGPSNVELLKPNDSERIQRKGNHRKLIGVQKTNSNAVIVITNATTYLY